MENIEKLKTSDDSVQHDINWLAEAPNRILNDYSDLIKFLLKQNEDLRKSIEKIKIQLDRSK